MSYEDFDRMENLEARFRDTSLNENSFRRLVGDFGNFIPGFLTQGPVDVPERALNWTLRDANNLMYGSGEADRI